MSVAGARGLRARGRGGWALALTAAILGCGARAQTPPAEPVVRISMKQFMFAPSTLTVKVGATVTWVNADQEPHTVVSTRGAFRSGALDTNESFSYRFSTPGTYEYFCTLHPQMKGSVVVE